MNSLVIIQAAFTLTALPPLPSDTPPALPIPIAQLAQIRTAQDVVAITLLADGSRAPQQLVLPQLENRRHTLEYMRVHYPESMRAVASKSTPIAWIYVDDGGKVGQATLLTTSGHAELDSLSLTVLRMALFKPAQHDGRPIGVWTPFPARIPPYTELIATLKSADSDISETPREVAYTHKPVLLNRNRVEAAIIRIVHQVDPRMRELNDAFARAQNAGSTTFMDIYIDEEGVVRNAIVSKTSGNTDLDNNAINIAKMMRFSAARNGDKPVAVWIQVPIRFKAN